MTTRLPDEAVRIALTKRIWEKLAEYDYIKEYHSFDWIKSEVAKECGYIPPETGAASSCPICRFGSDYADLFDPYGRPSCGNCSLYLEGTLCEYSDGVEEEHYDRPYYRWHDLLYSYRIHHEDNYSEQVSKKAQKAAAKLVDELETGKAWFYDRNTYRWVRKRKE